ncbi:MAG: repeat-containing protein [Pedosphaera sp.]|nr:repeat-containing protein [Pedosphaera sp.]
MRPGDCHTKSSGIPRRVGDTTVVEKRRRNGIALGVLAAFLLIAVSPSLLHWREPGYEGKKVTFWLRQLRVSGQEREARAALKCIGPDAVPWILPKFGARDSNFKTKLEKWADQQPWIELQFNHANEEWSHGVQAIQILGPQAKAAIPALTAMLTDPPIASFAVQALAGIGPDALPTLVQALTNQSPVARSAALLGLSSLGTNAEPQLPAIIAALPDANPGVWHAALEAVIQVGENRPDLTVPVLIGSLQTGDSTARGSIILALSSLGKNQPALVVPALMKGLEDLDPRIRFSAAIALGRFKADARPAVPKLMELLQDTKARGGGAIARTLKEIIGAEAVLPICQALAGRSPMAQARMISLLADFGGDAEAAVPTLIGFMKAEDSQVRLTAIYTLGKIRRKSGLAVPRLIESLAAEDDDTQLAAATTLASFGNEAKDAVPVLLELVTKENLLKARGAGRGSDGKPPVKGYNLPMFQRSASSAEFIPFLSFESALQQIDPEAAKQAGVR